MVPQELTLEEATMVETLKISRSDVPVLQAAGILLHERTRSIVLVHC